MPETTRSEETRALDRILTRECCILYFSSELSAAADDDDDDRLMMMMLMVGVSHSDGQPNGQASKRCFGGSHWQWYRPVGTQADMYGGLPPPPPSSIYRMLWEECMTVLGVFWLFPRENTSEIWAV
jgi:hypothetical protein